MRKFRRKFDALELHAVVHTVECDGSDEIIGLEQDDSARRPVMFSVYGHLKNPGGVECLRDFKTYKGAVRWMKATHALCDFPLGFEDFWEHGKQHKTMHSLGREER